MKQQYLYHYMAKFFLFPGALVLMLYLNACSPKYTTMTPELHLQMMADLKIGTLNLNCQFECDWSWLGKFKEMVALHNANQWEPLAMLVMQVGHEKDIAYYFLGRAAEGLGYKQAAKNYYQRSAELSGDTVNLHHYRSLDNGCAGIDLASVLPTRLASLKENNLSQPSATPTAMTREGKQATQATPSNTKSDQQTSYAQLIPSAQHSLNKVAAWLVSPEEFPIGKPCKEFLATLSLPYLTSQWSNERFEISHGRKIHPDIAQADIECSKERIFIITLLSKEFHGKDDLLHAKQLTDKIIASLNLTENGWKLVSSDLDGTQTGWRTGYGRTYRRDNAEVEFEANYTSREQEGRWVQINIWIPPTN